MKPSRDEYYMRMALNAATRATCDRRHVGAVIVHKDRLLATGFNGAPRGMPECDEVGHLMEDGHCIRTIHAEENAITWVGIERLESLRDDEAYDHKSMITMYVTTGPCSGCMHLIIQSGIQRVVYGSQYRSPTHTKDKSLYSVEVAQSMGIEMDFLDVESLK